MPNSITQADFDEQSPEFQIVLKSLHVASTVVYVDIVKKFYFHGHDLSLLQLAKGVFEQWVVGAKFIVFVAWYMGGQYVKKIRD